MFLIMSKHPLQFTGERGACISLIRLETANGKRFGARDRSVQLQFAYTLWVLCYISDIIPSFQSPGVTRTSGWSCWSLMLSTRIGYSYALRSITSWGMVFFVAMSLPGNAQLISWISSHTGSHQKCPNHSLSNAHCAFDCVTSHAAVMGG